MKKILSLLLALLLVISILPVSASAAMVTKDEVTRAIAIVFDNSGSMYEDTSNWQNNPDAAYAWCRATYAMQAFANMMNPNDQMLIYPMHPITVGKGGSEVYNWDNPLKIRQQDAAKIQQIYTPDPQGTPIETIPAALTGLSSTTADEKWLIVLTDGTSFYENDVALTTAQTEKRLGEELTICRQQVNVMYLGIGSQTAKPSSVTGSYQYHEKETNTSEEVLSALSSMCNIIFGRKELSNVTSSTKNISFDVSMGKLILLVQGQNITDVTLNGMAPTSVSDMKYAELGGGYRDFKPDKALQGALVIYDQPLDAGEYTLSYSGSATSVACYYEPYVDLYVELLDENGNVVDPNAENVAGKYTIRYCMVDKDGNETNSALLGSTSYLITYTLNGEPKEHPASAGGTIELDVPPDSTLDADFKVTYLDGYTITRDAEDMNWPKGGLKFAAPAAGDLNITISGGQQDYKLSTLPQGEKFQLSFAYDGVQLTNDQLGGIEQLKVTLEGGDGAEGMKPVVAQLKQDGSYYVELAYGGSAMETQCGSYTLKATAVYRNEDDKLTKMAAASAGFTVTDDSRQLTMEVTASDGYYQISEIGSASPIIVKLLYSGQNLTEEELKSFEPTLSNLQGHLIKEMDVAQSAYIYRFDPDNAPAEGDYELNITVSGVNEIGRPQKQSHELEYSFGLLPMWLKVLIPILILLLILLIIWLIMNQPRLPKNIYVKSMDFIVDGDPVNVAKTPRFTGAGKKKGTIVVASPRAGNDPMAEQAMNLTVKAVSPRRTKSKNRKALVTNATVARPNNVIYWRLKSTAYVPDPESSGSFISSTNGKPGFKPVEIGNGSEVEIQAETDSSSVIFKCKLGFK